MKLTEEEKKLIKEGNIEQIWDKARKEYPYLDYLTLKAMLYNQATH